MDAEDYGETELEVGSMVEVNNPPIFGVIRWIGHIRGIKELVAGIELVRKVSASVFLRSSVYTFSKFFKKIKEMKLRYDSAVLTGTLNPCCKY